MTLGTPAIVAAADSAVVVVVSCGDPRPPISEHFYPSDQNGVNTRPKRALPMNEAVATGGRGSRKPYFGFCYVDGKLGEHIAEFPVREWSWTAVKGVISRFGSGALTVDGRSFKFNSHKVERV